MAGWEDYKKAISAAEELFKQEMEAAWTWHQGEVANLLTNPKINQEMGRVSMARAIARFWSRMERSGMALAGVEQVAFEAHIKPLRSQATPKPS